MTQLITKAYVKTSLFLDALRKDQRGLATIEYALLATTMVGIITAVLAGDGADSLKGAMDASFQKISDQLKGSK
ncbi:hypothetical protein [Parendozoicomonas sp. Alg238-R29]|uniref:Flp family type IVb pilin n=1 Tax=Parendozoicomonas sp. Alg238-R29 TaxID=2993446 RepID=UPI00248E6281|nr:hypothetical protein [Parendozoicomonas sp. Alg238-R29]